MIIKCIENKIENVCTDKSKEVLYSIYKRLDGEVEALKIGRFYIVYSLFETDLEKWYWIKSDKDVWFPLWYPQYYFEVVDASHSQYWIESKRYGVGPVTKTKMGKLFSFRECTDMDCFYHNLLDASENEVKIFERYARIVKDEAVF